MWIAVRADIYGGRLRKKVDVVSNWSVRGKGFGFTKKVRVLVENASDFRWGRGFLEGLRCHR